MERTDWNNGPNEMYDAANDRCDNFMQTDYD